MTEEGRQDRRLTASVAAIALVLTSLGGGVKWIVDTNEKMGVTTSVVDSLVHNDSTVFKRLARVEKKLGINSKGQRIARPKQDVGLARKVWQALF